MKLKPMADNVLLKQHEAAETTVSGIILATTNKEKPAIYEVVSAGPGTKEVTMTVKVGDKVGKDTVVAVLEAMKMENEIFAGQAGTIASVEVAQGASVRAEQVLITMN